MEHSEEYYKMKYFKYKAKYEQAKVEQKGIIFLAARPLATETLNYKIQPYFILSHFVIF
jgi:pyrroline-5-carboxylate reductase